ncbi:enoyl-CoA hydratase/carnithine racemase [Bacillus pakistanensis]|uniref:Enoyl-CoA hydratase/carnithine racemase n=1 Tax=Rossellomorea pakistanensis TaxID=992288 RepID=A0ABS2NFW4_9BACI|nr:enoyl-CoA hydratase/isomerase family protein [Bacillus pakistanensis]MBM7586722.1 enoyl-CoA hydratase/carnithine racemase [Bacillus pakistanensis]
MDYLLHKSDTGILTFSINRVNKRNAVNYEVMSGLKRAIAQTRLDEEIKALVITGAGNHAFCSGGDLSEFHGLKTEEQAWEMLNRMGELLYEIATLPKPTIAWINGVAIGGGCEIAAACDFRISKKGVKMGFVQGNLAITTGWGGASLLYERILPSHAMRLLMTADLYDVEELYQMKFIDHFINGDGSEIDHYLHSITTKNVHVIKAYKQSLLNKWNISNLHEKMMKEIRSCAILWAKEEHHEAVDRFLNKK